MGSLNDSSSKVTSNIHERVYESRFGYVDQLQNLGADIELI